MRSGGEDSADGPTFRGSDEVLDREIATLESHARLRLKRASLELRELDRELRELKRERARRRRATAFVPGEASALAKVDPTASSGPG